MEWAKRGQELGAGEILLTSVDNDGTGKGYDLSLIKAVTDEVDIPVIASGGMGTLEDLTSVVLEGNADAVAMGRILHLDIFSVVKIREHCFDHDIPVRTIFDGDTRDIA